MGGPKCVSEHASGTHCFHIRGRQSLLSISLFALLWEENSPTWYQDIFGIGHSSKLPGTFWAYCGTWPLPSPKVPKRDLINFSPSHKPSVVAFTAIMWESFGLACLSKTWIDEHRSIHQHPEGDGTVG